MQRRSLVLAAGLFVGAANAQQEVAEISLPTDYLDPVAVEALGLRCRTPVFERLDLSEAPSDCSYNSTSVLSQYDPTYLYEIPVVFHVIRSGSGTGNITDAQIQSQIDVLNEDFRALAGSNGAAGFDTMIQFELADVDPDGNPTTGITRSSNTTWYNDGGSYYNTLAWDTNRYLNIYTNSAGGYLGYVPDLPQGGGLVGTSADRVVVLWSSVGKNAPLSPYNQGRTVTHEVGHYLGLFHTFDFGCGSASACFTSGDRICDTNQEANPRYGCPGSASSCGSSDPFRNYMDYTDDLCMVGFTVEQSNRMRCTLENWRPDLASVCGGAAQSVLRNAGSNPLSLTASAPVLGGNLAFTVDLSTTGHSMALVLGYNGPLDLTLGGGQRLLVDITDPAGDLLGLSAKSGPFAIWSMPVLPSTCGLAIHAQALHFGAATPFALSNARDLTVGP